MIPTPHDPFAHDLERRARAPRRRCLGLVGTVRRRHRRGFGAAADARECARAVLSAEEARRQRRRPDAASQGTRGAPPGTILYVTGRVLDTQRQAAGRRRARAVASQRIRPLSPPCRYRCVRTARSRFPGLRHDCAPDADGRYRIKTIKPPPYSGRTPHIHFIVANGGTRAHDADVLRGRGGQRARRPLSLPETRRPPRVDGPLRRPRAAPWKTDALAVDVGHRPRT